MGHPHQIVDASTAAVVVDASTTNEPARDDATTDTAATAATTGTSTASVVVVADDNSAQSPPQIKPLLHKVATRARRSGLRVALFVIFFFGFASLVLTARSAAVTRAWQSSFSSGSSSHSTIASIRRSATRTVVPVLVHHDDTDGDTDTDTDAQLDSTASSPNDASDASATQQQPTGTSISTAASPLPPPRYALLRVISNALPPRHDPNRTLQNLRFILEHEQLETTSISDRIVTHFVVNRILDTSLLQAIRSLLTTFNASFTELPFDLHAYANVPYRVVSEDTGVDSVHAVRNDIRNDSVDVVGVDAPATDWTNVQQLNELFDYKNRYALHVNAARNTMLALGRSLHAHWLLPWDQNCFLTQTAWRRIRADLQHFDAANATGVNSVKYVQVPMDRLTQENAFLLETPFYEPHAPHAEPQLIFRSDATERFDERFRYGKRDKAALLVRLGLPGVWQQWGWSHWEQQRTFLNVSNDVSNVPSTGFVVRLFSGHAQLEADAPAAAYWRELKRGEGIVTLLQTLERRVMAEIVQFTPTTLALWRLDVLNAMRHVYNTRGSKGTLQQLVHDAMRATHVVLNGGSVDSFEAIAYNTTSLVLAYELSRDDRFATKALAALTTAFVNITTALSPNVSNLVNETEAARNLRPLAALPMLLDSVRLLFYPVSLNETSDKDQHATALVSNTTRAGVLDWMQQLLVSLQTNAFALREWRASQSLNGLQYDLYVAALAAFANDSLTYRFTIGTLQGRLVTMVDATTGELRLPLGVAQAPYTMLSLATWGSALAAAAPLNMTAHLLAFDLTPDAKEETTTRTGGLLCRMVAAHIPCCQDLSKAADGACVALLQAATPVHLFIYRRLVRSAMPGCLQFAARPACRTIAQLPLRLHELSTTELRRYNLAPYPYLHQTEAFEERIHSN